MTNYEAVIGLETHIQLNTTTKIFCSCKADSWGEEANTNICPVCTGMPGVLPVLNKAAVEKGIVLARAMNAELREISFFDRKNYFYPDLPKGYQISQYDMSLAQGGYLDVTDEEGKARRVAIRKMHLEEDAGKTRNVGAQRMIDFNRCGVPLIEMVTEPDLRSADEAARYLAQLRQLLRWLEISEADMEKAHLRCDANVSIRLAGEDILNPKTEIKNVNSIEAVRQAINKEIERQIREVEGGGTIEAWTLEWDDENGELLKMRSKETEADYRYFREPDILPLRIDNEWRQSILKDFPELPQTRRKRLMEQYRLPYYDADVLTSERKLSDYFEKAVEAYGGEAKKVSNWMMNDVLRMVNDKVIPIDRLRLTPSYLAEILSMLDRRVINQATAKSLLVKVEENRQTPRHIVEQEGLLQVSDDSAIRAICREIVDKNTKEAEAYRGGKETLIGWFVGQVMKEMRGKADPKLAREIMEELLRD